MLKEIYKEELPVLASPALQPCVSVIMPFNPKMITKFQLAITLKRAFEQVKKELYKKNSKEIAAEVLDRLQNVIDNLDYTTHKKSIAIYVSPALQKVYYLSIPVTEKIIVNTSFEIRELVLNKKDKHEFLLLVVSARKEKIFLGNNEKLKLIVANNVAHIKRDLPSPVANFSDAKTQKEIQLKNFLRYIDNGLDLIMKVYPLPLFIMTTEKTMGWFRQATKHNQYITGFVHGSFEDATETELLHKLKPHIENWKLVKEKDVRNRIGAAESDFRLAAGIHDVWKQANRKHGQLLVVEKDFNCPAFVTSSGETVFCNAEKQNEFETKDVVGDIIEKVLASGGDVEFVDELRDYNRIALIEYYRDNS